MIQHLVGTWILKSSAQDAYCTFSISRVIGIKVRILETVRAGWKPVEFGCFSSVFGVIPPAMDLSREKKVEKKSYERQKAEGNREGTEGRR